MRRFQPAGALTGLAVALAAGLLLSATPANGAVAARQIACGSHLAADTTLTRDLHCSGDGLTLAPGIRLDMAGHQLSGDGTGVGISVVDGDRNAVRGGKIQNWQTGIHFVGASIEELKPVTLSGLRVVDAPLVLEAATITLERSNLLRSSIFPSVTSLTVRDSVLRSSSTFGEMNNVSVVDTRVIGGGLALDENNSLSITRSRLDGTGYTGSPLFCSVTVTIADSSVTHYAVPIYRSNFCTLDVAGTRFSDNPGGAIVSELSDTPTTVSKSTFRGSGVAISGESLQVTDSTFVGNTGGVSIGDPTGSTITGSVFRSNAGSGIYTDGTSLAVRGNTAIGNGEYGIHAPAATDLGGNVARPNGTADCVGLVCTRR